jgi:hypothetical protein
MKIVVKIGLLCALGVAAPAVAFAYGDPALRKIKLQCAAEISALTPNGKSWRVSNKQLPVFYACVERKGGPKIKI